MDGATFVRCCRLHRKSELVMVYHRLHPAVARVCLVTVLAIWTFGCEDDTPTIRMSGRGFVAMVGVGQDDPLWPVLRATAVRAHRRLALDVPLRTEAPPRSSVHAQRRLLRRLLDEGMVGACIQVTDPAALRDTARLLVTHGVRVVTMMRPLDSAGKFSHCGLDDEAIGEALADAVREALPDGGTVVVLHADSESHASRVRRRAFHDAVSTARSIHVLLEYDCGAVPARAREIMRETMRRYPRLGAWVVLDDWPFWGHEAGDPLVPPSCRVIGVHPFPRHWRVFDDGSAFAMVGAEYDRIAERAVTHCIAQLVGTRQRQTTFHAPLRTVWANNVTTFKLDWLRWASDMEHAETGAP